jgi:ESCRT-II complex subunit VPS36
VPDLRRHDSLWRELIAKAAADGILQNISLENQSKQGDVEDAFKDLEALMVRAGDMVKLVQTLNTKLNQQQSVSASSGVSSAEEEAAQTFLRSSLVQLGLPAPAVTADMMADESMYLEGLAKELGGLLTGSPGTVNAQGLMVGKNGKGLVGMDEVWGLWNRVRGVCEYSIKLASVKMIAKPYMGFPSACLPLGFSKDDTTPLSIYQT